MKLDKDTLERTVKTFIQAFGGNLIPAVIKACASVPESWGEVPGWLGSLFSPQLVIGSCCAAGICAVWNYYLSKKKAV